LLPQGKAHYIPEFETATHILLDNLHTDDVAIIFSAGDAVEVSRNVFDKLHERHEQDGITDE